MQQDQIATTSCNGGDCLRVNIGNNWVGTSTGAFITASTTTLYTSTQVRLDLQAYPNSSYTGIVADCIYERTVPTTPGRNKFELSKIYEVSNGCTFDPTLYYQVVIFNPNGSTKTQFWGSNINLHGWQVIDEQSIGIGGWIPEFDIVGNGFQINPTTADSGIYLSGAKGFCNDAFASSTGIGSTISNGFCIALGYLFVPTPDSINQFGDLGLQLQGRIPFSYFYDIQNSFNSQTASSSSMQSLSISLPDISSSTPLGSLYPTNIGILSTTTIDKYLPNNIRVSMLFLASAAIWVSVGFMLYRRIVPKNVI